MDNEILLLVAIIGLTLVILNAIFLWNIFSAQRKAGAVKTWPSVTGTVVSSALESRRSTNNRASINYPAVEYSYQVGGRKYRGTRIAPGPEAGGSTAPRVIERYPAGAQVSVFYDPKDPSDAVLEAKAPAQVLMWIGLVALDVVLCGMAALFARV